MLGRDPTKNCLYEEVRFDLSWTEIRAEWTSLSQDADSD